ncbi:MAG: hypothetical protein Q9218_006842 [Villophora microphyllina]
MRRCFRSLPSNFRHFSGTVRHFPNHPTLLRSRHPPSPKSQQIRPFSIRHRLRTIRAGFTRLPLIIHLPLITLLTIITWLPVLWFFFTHIFQPMSVKGPSMYPFLNTDHYTSTRKDIIAVNMYKPGQDVRRGDVVVFRSPLDPEKVVVKRVIAIEGDIVYTRLPYPIEKQEVSVGHVWVEGEHPEHTRWSYDSNAYGAVSKSLIMGKVIGVVWPWSRRSWIDSDDWPGSRRVIEKKNEETMDVAT